MPAWNPRGLKIGVAALWLGVAATAQAATTPLTVEQLTDASDYVVLATVEQFWVERDARGNGWTRVEIEVEAVLKGPADLDALRLDVAGGLIGGQGSLVLDSPRFDEGEPVLVFAERLESGLLVLTGAFQGKYTVRLDPDSGREMLVQFNPPPEQRYDHRFIPHPAPADRILLDDMQRRIEARVRQGWDGEPIPGKSLERLHELHPSVEVSR